MKIRLLVLAIILYTTAQAQTTSHPSGFYMSDSLFFTFSYPVDSGHKVEVAVNCFSKDVCFQPYTAGFWLYNRNLLPNTWENQQLTRSSTLFNFDTLVPRGHLQKANVVWIRIKNSADSVIKQHAYFLHLHGNDSSLFHTMPVVHLLVDSMEAFGPEGFYGHGDGLSTPLGFKWNYHLDQHPLYKNIVQQSRVEKDCIVQILDKSGTSLLQQQCGIRLSGNTSRDLPNKSIAIVARKKYSPGKKKFTLSLDDNDREKYKWLRFRSGASAQLHGFGTHEIFERIADGTKIGEVKVAPMVVYINGSYWSLSFAQDKVQEYTAAHVFDLDDDSISIIRPVDLFSYSDFAPILQQLQVDSSVGMWKNISGEHYCFAAIEKGTKTLFEAPGRRLFDAATDTSVSLAYEQIDSLLDVASWVNFLAIADFAQYGISHQTMVATAPQKKMFILRNEADGFGQSSPSNNYWSNYFFNPAAFDSTFTSLVCKNVIMKNQKCIELFSLRYQDLLNTSFKADRTTAIVQRLSKEVMKEYPRHWLSWFPNGGIDSTAQASLLLQVSDYCAQRPEYSWQQLANQWLTDKNFTLSDRKNVSLNLDSLSGNYIRVKLNTLAIDTNWSGLYYPAPALQISVDTADVPPGKVLIWREYPDSALSFNLFASSDVTLTPVFVDATTAIGEVRNTQYFSVSPNPTKDEVHVKYSGNDIKQIQVISLNGKLELNTTSKTFSVRHLAPGAYMCMLTTPRGVFSEKLMIIR